MKISVFPRKGFILEGFKPYNDSIDVDDASFDVSLYERTIKGRKRGTLEGKFSSASFRRFRNFCLCYTVPNVLCFGVTLTVPGLSTMNHDDFRDLWHRVSRSLARYRVPCVWRVELQRRGMPHIHCVVFGDYDDVVLLMRLWYKYLDRYPIDSLERLPSGFEVVPVSRRWANGYLYCFHVDVLDGSHRSFRYLVSHSTKAKRVQLGFHGRQWGVVTRDAFVEDYSYSFEIAPCVYWYVLRRLRRLTRTRCNGKYGCSAWLCNPKTVVRLIDYAESLARSEIGGS